MGARVILVPVGDEDGTDTVPIAHEVGNVGDDEVDAGHPLFGEHDPGVDYYDVVAALDRHHVAADFAETPERDYPYM